MAEDEDGVSNKQLPKNSDNEESSDSKDHAVTKPDLGIEKSKYNSNESAVVEDTERSSASPVSTGAIRKEENPFSFRHFLKRDLSLPGNSTYENTGARPKVYANTVQHSPTKIDIHAEPRREKPRSADSQTKEENSDFSVPRISDSSSSLEIPFSVVDNTASKSNLYSDSSEIPYYHRPNIASESLGMPSLPDFVQDHILVEQSYLNSNGPISVDMDNLPDFTFNTSYNQASSSSGRRNNSSYGSCRNYDLGGASTSQEQAAGWCPSLDLPGRAEAPHLSLDLTESVNSADRRNVSPRRAFPLDLPSNAGAESMRLPDFLPLHPGRISPEPDQDSHYMQEIIVELERTKSELAAERGWRIRLERDVAAARSEVAAARASETALRGRLHASNTPEEPTELESNVAKLKNQIKKLKEELSASQAETRSLRATQRGASRDLRQASMVADTSLRELLAGIEQLKSLSSVLDPT